MLGRDGSRSFFGLELGNDATGPIGLDFSANRLCLAQVARRGPGLALRDARSLSLVLDGEPVDPFASRKAMRGVLKEARAHARFRGRRVVTHVPAEDLRLMVLNYSLANEAAEGEQILGLVRERMRDDLSDHVVDFVPIRTSGAQQGDRSALVAVAPEAPVIHRLERLHQAGLEVVAMEIVPVALRRIVASTLEPDSNSIVLVIRFGERASEVTLFSGRRLLLYREIEIGVESALDGIAKGLDCDRETALELLGSFGVGGAGSDGELRFEGIDDEELEAGADIVGTLREILRPRLRELVEQTHKAISYAAFQTRGTTIERTYLMEGERAIPGLGTLIAEMLQVPIEPLDPFSGLLPDPAHAGGGGAGRGRLTMAVGHALRGLVDG